MTGKDLLYKYLDYQYLWSSPNRINDKPSQIRLKQLEALLEAFGLTKKYVNPLIQIKYSILGEKEKLSRSQHLNKLTNVQYFEQSEFLYDREYKENNEVANRALNKIKELYKKPPESRISRPVDIKWMFNNLLNFRKNVFKITYPWGGMLEGFSVGLIYSEHLQSNLKKIITDNIEEIDDTLWLIIDPKKRNFDLETMKSEFNYPDVDLDNIDLEWRIENY
ncbi:hypothetical protein [uncultured Aquimarina sp.]|uniref:hypothetical protein n=1 Tax=uncultured Aquimarina sp. TaxID=575652 RepID=UPI00261FD9DF|nr:hypothetical protein [uncultured Aquimarina sp.]